MDWKRSTYRRAMQMAAGALTIQDFCARNNCHCCGAHVAMACRDGQLAGILEGRDLGLQKGFEIGKIKRSTAYLN